MRIRRSGRGLLPGALVAIAAVGCSDRHPGFGDRPPKGFHILVDQGSPAGADAYYKTLDDTLTGPLTSVDEVLAYMGYAGLKAVDVQNLASVVLMDFDRLSQQVSDPEGFKKAFPHPFAKDDLVASRFFAPKISDVSDLTSPRTYGWRKVVRFRVRKPSGAVDHKIEMMYLLFNHFIGEKELGNDPFGNESVNNQVMLVPADAASAWWLVFGPLSAGGKRIAALKASFDAPRLKDPQADYFVPEACAHCHGGRSPRLNFLDTDHWFDRSTDDDFKAIGASDHPVLFDGKKDTESAEHHAAFDTVRTLNLGVESQNVAVDAGAESFQTKSVKKWNELHPSGKDQHAGLFDRSIGASAWSSANANDAVLLPELNRLCYRCHGSIEYDVFDRAEVKSLAGSDDPQRLLSLGTLSKFRMPQDRELKPEVIKSLTDLLDKLGDE